MKLFIVLPLKPQLFILTKTESKPNTVGSSRKERAMKVRQKNDSSEELSFFEQSTISSDVAGEEGFEPSAYGFGDRRSTS